tara:strand:- start:562 stop:792 length:231 start_codon:yes stop_codon:yes gene_type:complete
MKKYVLLASKILLVTAAFAVLLFAVILTSTLVAQGDQHPDSWVTTACDIAIMVVVAALYIVTLAYMLRKFFKLTKR